MSIHPAPSSVLSPLPRALQTTRRRRPTERIDQLDRHLRRLRASRHAGLVIASFVLLGIVNATLEWLYAASNHPVSYAEGQTSFDAVAVKGWYAAMSEAGTLGTYVGTQFFDFLFIAALATFAITFGSAIRRLHTSHRRSMAVVRAAVFALVAGTVFDVFENLVSFVMLTSPADFPAALVVPYSAAAVLKFALIATGGFTLLAMFVAGLVRAAFSRRGATHAADRQIERAVAA